MFINISEEFDHKDEVAIKTKGQVFTPRYICEDIIDRLDINISENVCEPSVGKGIFVFTLLEKFRKTNSIYEIVEFVENRLHTFEIDDVINEKFKSLVVEYLLELGYDKPLRLSNLKCSDFLINGVCYDVIFGNPPYIRIQNLEEDYISDLRNRFKSMNGNSDIFYAFIEKALMNSSRFGFITPNSFIKNKSASMLRSMMISRISYLKDNGHERIWADISTYTSIFIGGETTDTLEWVSPDGLRSVVKRDLNENWQSPINGDNNMKDMVHSMHGGIATLKDSIYVVGDDVEDGICKKLVKATKNETKKIIYPYIDGKIIDEDVIRTKYPNCYTHLLNNQEGLLNRDRGNQSKYPTWYAYGRSQGLIRKVKGISVVVPKLFRRSLGPEVIVIDEDTLIVSGLFCDIKPECYDKFIEILKSSEFIRFCEVRNNQMRDVDGSDDVFLTLSSTTIKEFTY